MPVDKPLLRYHGSKWQIADWVISHFPEHYTYVEPFGGGASVLLRKPRSKGEVYNDLDAEIVNLFRVLRDQPEDLLRRLYLTPFARDAYEEAFAQARDPDLVVDPVERARITLTVSYQALSSSGTTRKSRGGWRSWAKPGWGQLPVEYWELLDTRVIPVAERLRSVIVENRPALEVIERNDDVNTLFYCDPPYVGETRKEGLRIYRHEMQLEDHRVLLETLGKVKGMVLLSGYDNPHYREWLPGWECVTTTAKTEGHNTATECLWLSPNASRARSQLNLFGAAA